LEEKKERGHKKGSTGGNRGATGLRQALKTRSRNVKHVARKGRDGGTEGKKRGTLTR